MGAQAAVQTVQAGARAGAKAAIAFLVVNPHSANGATGRQWAKLEAEVRGAFGEIEVGFTSRPFEAPDIARRALAAGHRTIVAVGGDGTINEVVNGFFEADGALVAPDAVLALLPTGTGGDFKRSVGVPPKWSDAVRHTAAAGVRRIDVGRVKFRAHDGSEAVRHFVNVGSFGVSGAVDEEVNRSTKWLGGKLSFMLASLRALWGYRDREIRLSINGGPVETVKVTTLAMGNGQFFGGGMWVAPEAKLDDGLLHCTLWSGYGVVDFVFRSSGLYSGAHVGWSGTRCFQARTVHAESEERVLLDIDGEQPGLLPATFDVVPGAIGFRG